MIRNVELEKMWKEAVVARFRYCLSICPDELRKATRISGSIFRLRAVIRFRDLPDTKER
jgi:hypothetical protein